MVSLYTIGIFKSVIHDKEVALPPCSTYLHKTIKSPGRAFATPYIVAIIIISFGIKGKVLRSGLATPNDERFYRKIYEWLRYYVKFKAFD